MPADKALEKEAFRAAQNLSTEWRCICQVCHKCQTRHAVAGAHGCLETEGVEKEEEQKEWETMKEGEFAVKRLKRR